MSGNNFTQPSTSLRHHSLWKTADVYYKYSPDMIIRRSYDEISIKPTGIIFLMTSFENNSSFYDLTWIHFTICCRTMEKISLHGYHLKPKHHGSVMASTTDVTFCESRFCDFVFKHQRRRRKGQLSLRKVGKSLLFG